MANDADGRTSIDDVIDEVARAMTLTAVPDLRAAVAGRLNALPASGVWWQPALAASIAIAGAVMLWPDREAEPPRVTEKPIVQTVPSQSPPAADTAAATPQPAVPSSAARRLPAARRTVLRTTTGASADEPAFAVIEVAPIVIEALVVETTHSIETVDMPRLVVESLDVEPLPRSNP